jgi:DNA-binding response OmpR family regulator
MADTNASQQREKPFVVVINDDELWCHGAAAILQLAGYQAVEGFDGVEAIRLTISHAPDLLIINWMMPQKSGLDAIREIRKMKNFAQLPILMVSVNPSSMAPEAIAAGATAYLELPVDGDMLLHTVTTLLHTGHKDSL